MMKRITSLFGILACLTVVAVLGAVIMMQNKTAGADSMDVMGSRKEHTSKEPSGQKTDTANGNHTDGADSAESGQDQAASPDQAKQAKDKQSAETTKENKKQARKGR